MVAAIHDLRHEPSGEDLASARVEYLETTAQRYEPRGGLNRWVSYHCLLVYRNALEAIASGMYNADHCQLMYLRAVAIARAEVVAETLNPSTLNAEDRAFYDQVQQARENLAEGATS